MARTAFDAVAHGLDRLRPLTGLRGLAQRAQRDNGQPGGPTTGPGVEPSAAPHAGHSTQAGAARPVAGAGLAAVAAARPASPQRHGLAAGDSHAGTGSAPADDQQLLLQLARVLRREAERDGIDLSDTAP